MEFSHPQVTILDEHEDMPRPRILPVYPLTEGIKQSDMRRLTQEVSRVVGQRTGGGHAPVAPSNGGRCIEGSRHRSRLESCPASTKRFVGCISRPISGNSCGREPGWFFRNCW